MKTAKYLLLLSCMGFSLVATAQKGRPSIRSNGPKMSIRVDGRYLKDSWNISPELKPDPYKTSAKKVTFYTDIDSISIVVDKKNPVDFNVIYKNDTAWTRVEYQPSRLDQLKAAAKYNSDDRREVPTFTYQNKESPELKSIRQKFNLDSIAGEGSMNAKFINLMNWVHNIIRHDGGSENPVLKNTVDLIRICQEEDRGVNCRMMAMVLNECYLAMGFKSRYITCMPKELKFDDCHVINMVFNEETNSWVWIDPTFNAYVMNEKGELLGVAEVRSRLVNNQPLILNPDANWNNKVTQTKYDYLENYMAKNLYRIEAQAYSCYNAETWAAVKDIQYVELLPLDALNQTPQHTEQVRQDTGTKFTRYKTNNPNLFWVKP